MPLKRGADSFGQRSQPAPFSAEQFRASSNEQSNIELARDKRSRQRTRDVGIGRHRKVRTAEYPNESGPA